MKHHKSLHEIRNKMSPIVHLVAMLDRGVIDLNNIDLTNVKRSINDLCDFKKYDV